MTTINVEHSTSAIGGASVRAVRPDYIRLPLPGNRCPFTGLSRSTLAELCTPCPVNTFNPPVESRVIRKRGAVRGIRLIKYDSLMAHLEALPNDVGAEVSTDREAKSR